MASQSLQSTRATQQDVFRRRMPFVVLSLLVVAFVLFGRLISFQFQIPDEVVAYLDGLRNSNYTSQLDLAAQRGLIYDRDGQVLAVNTLEYQIGLSPRLLENRREAATRIASILGLNELQLFESFSNDTPWILLSSRVSAEVAQRLSGLQLGSALTMTPLPRRSYPQGVMASQVIGFLGGDLQGYYGIEGYYQTQLAGRQVSQSVSNIPFEFAGNDLIADSGSNVILTIDRDVQHVVEDILFNAITETGSTRGTIIVMDPRNGDILAMANYPTFDPNAYFNITDPSVLRNIAIADNYEPGSVLKVITVAAALDHGSITRDFTYNDQGVIEVGGIQVRNWNRGAWGVQDTTQILVNSLNVGVTEIALRMGTEAFYQELSEFGFGRLTGIDLQGEEAGILRSPGNPDWSESMFATNSFGQGISVTPLQMLTAVSAIANGGLMMQPRVVHQIIDGDNIITAPPVALGRPITAETASIVTEMMVRVVSDGLDDAASVAGYTIAGKTGTAEIPSPTGYEANASIVTFVGFFPADAPQVSVLIRLDRPRDYWASTVAAPIFQRLAERLAILLEIPPDAIRYELAANGGSVNNIRR